MEAIQLRGGAVTYDRRLDRIPEFDIRSRAYAAAQVFPSNVPVNRTWSLPMWLDQGSEGACVGFAFTHELAARPRAHLEVTNEYARGVYKRAQQIDVWPGEDYEGTSVLAGAKVLHERRLIGSYRWAFTVEELVLSVGYLGPAVIGVDWWSGMFNPDAAGYISPTGYVAGGHAIVVIGVSKDKRHFRLRNSWGKDWGLPYGNCFVRWEHMEMLLANGGDACIPLART